jgi:hypothetical protein
MGQGNLWSAAAVAAAAVGAEVSTTHDQRGTVELVIPRIDVVRFGRGGIELDVAVVSATATGGMMIAAAVPAAAISGVK